MSHWTRAVALGKEVGSGLGEARGTDRERALDFLIAANWLIEEASDRGVEVPDATVERRLRERIEAVPNGESEFKEEVASLGQTAVDVKLEIKAEAAAAMLRALVAQRVRHVAPADVADYYRHNRERFRVPDLRFVNLIEAIPTRSAAIALAKRVGPGKRFAGMALYEKVARQTPAEAAHRDNAELVHTIFAAVPGKIAGPVRFNHRWVLVVVRKVVPGRIKPLAAVKEQIAAGLTNERHRRALSSFVRAFQRKWVARTHCSPGFVVQKCSQYHGPVAPERNPLSSEST